MVGRYKKVFWGLEKPWGSVAKTAKTNKDCWRPDKIWTGFWSDPPASNSDGSVSVTLGVSVGVSWRGSCWFLLAQFTYKNCEMIMVSDDEYDDFFNVWLQTSTLDTVSIACCFGCQNKCHVPITGRLKRLSTYFSWRTPIGGPFPFWDIEHQWITIVFFVSLFGHSFIGWFHISMFDYHMVSRL